MKFTRSKFAIGFCALATLTTSFASATEIRPESIEFDIECLSMNSLRGRVSMTEENVRAREFIRSRLVTKQVKPAGDVKGTTYDHNFTNHYNWVHDAKVKGTSLIGIVYPNRNWTDEAPRVLIGAHYDGIAHCDPKFVAPEASEDDRTICNGATDNATSVAILLELVQTLPPHIKKPVAFAFWDSEESGLLGSDAFFKKPSIPLDQIVTYVNLDIVGLNLYKTLENMHIVLGAETGGPKLQTLTQSAIAIESPGFKYHQMSYAIGHGRSDMTSLYRNGLEIPSVFFSDGDGAIYHTTADDQAHVNFKKVHSVSRVLNKLVTALTETSKSDFTFQKPNVYFDKDSWLGQMLQLIFPKIKALRAGIPVPMFSDVPVVLELYEKLLAAKSENKLTDEQVEKLLEQQTEVKSILNAGEAEFSFSRRFALLKAVATYTLTAKNLTFIP